MSTAPQVVLSLPCIALTREQAARSIGMSLDHFEKHVQPEIRLVRRGRKVIVPTAELTAWVERNQEHVLEGR